VNPYSSVCGVITIYLALDISTFILTGNPSAARVASDFKTWVTHIVAAVSGTSRQVSFQGQVVRGVFVGLQPQDPSAITGKFSEYSQWASSCIANQSFAGSLMNITGSSARMSISFHSTGPFGRSPNNS